MFKRFIGLLLTMSMALSLTFTVPATAQGLTKKDIEEEAGLLQTLGIITTIADEQTGAEAITRAEFAVTVASILRLQDVKSTQRYFIDVPENHWAVNSINALVDLGAISQPEDKLFRPYDSITVNEAIKILLSVCGYSKYAQAQGGYPNGYIETARLLEMEVYGSTQPLTYYQLYKLLYEALQVNLYELENGTGRNYTLAQSDETLLSKYFDVYEATGLVTQAQGISLYPGKFEKGDSEESTSYVVIDEELYTSDINLYNYLGRFTTVFYVQEDRDDIPNIIYRKSCRKEGEVLEINSEDFISYSNYEISYYEDGREQKEDISNGAIVIKNGSLLNTNLEDDININIRIKLDANDEIFAIDTERKTDAEEKFVLQRETAYGEQTHWWHASGFPQAKVYYGSNTVRFCVPVYADQLDAEEKYFTLRTSRYDNINTSAYTIESFKTDLSNPYAAVIVDYIELGSDKATTKPEAYLVNKISKTVNADGDIVYELSAYATTTGDLVTYSSDSEDTFKKARGNELVLLERGDLVQLKVSALGNIVGYNMLYDYTNKEAKIPWGHITNNNTWRESDRDYDLVHTYVKTNQDGMLRCVYETQLVPSDMEYENINNCDRFVGFNGKGPMLIFDGKNVTVTTLEQGILSAEITGTEDLEDYWFSIYLAKIVSGVVYRDGK